MLSLRRRKEVLTVPFYVNLISSYTRKYESSMFASRTKNNEVFSIQKCNK